KAWASSLMEPLSPNRTRRFGIGFEMPEGPFRYKSKQAPVGLSDMEEALLIAAGAGFSGLALWDFSTPAPYPSRSARTFPATRSGGHTTLFFTNDRGLYVLDAEVAATKIREIEAPDEREKVLTVYRQRRRRPSHRQL